MPGIAPEWSADDYLDAPEQEFERSPSFAGEAVENARQALQDAGLEPETAEEIALHQKICGTSKS
jgi:hypothetical protein